MLDLDRKGVLFRLTWPIFIETGMRLLLGNISVFMIARHSDAAVAATGVATQVLNMLIMIFNIVATGSAIIISQHLGAGDRKTASQAVFVSILVNSAFGVAMSAVMLLFAEPIGRMMNVEGETLDYVAVMLRIAGGTCFTQAVIATLGAVFRNYGYTKIPMAVALAMNAANIAGNYLALFEPFGLPAYGVPGVAVSMAASAGIGAIWMVVVFLRRFNVRELIAVSRPFPFPILKGIYRIGLPSAAEGVGYNSSQLAVTYLITYMGAEVLAARVYAYNITTFVYILGLSVGMGTQILVGHLVGAGRNGQAYSLTFRNLYIALGSNIVFSLILMAFRFEIVGLYTDSEPIVKLAAAVLVADIFVETGRAFNHIGNGALRGAGDVKVPMVINILSMWGVGVLLCYLFGLQLHWGLIGVWIALGMDEWTRGLALILRWRSRVWERSVLVRRTTAGSS